VTRRAFLIAAIVSISVASGFSQTIRPAEAGRYGISVRLTDREFWSLMTRASEPDGHFRSDNLVSNEIKFQWVIPDLMRRVKPGGVYLGVGPEQNFTYIAALRPKIVFIVDVRRGNTDLHLMYKALFELSRDRVDFVSRLLARPRPEGLTPTSTAGEIFAAFAGVDPSERMLTTTLADIRHQLTTVHQFALTGDDLMRIEAIYRVFFLAGTRIQYSPYGSFGGTTQPTYAELMAATDEAAEPHSFLASDALFDAMRDLQQRNLVVPLVGDFAGPKTIRTIGDYARARGAVVTTFYVSNVEEYLQQTQRTAFCRNVATLPITAESTFIRAVRGDTLNPGNEGFVNQLAPMVDETRHCGER
jgi:hypothetical protein